MKYEYGIMVARPGHIHREGLTREQALEWIEGWEDDGGKTDVFTVCRRRIAEWEEYKSGESA
jgi:hypothetical protein